MYHDWKPTFKLQRKLGNDKPGILLHDKKTLIQSTAKDKT